MPPHRDVLREVQRGHVVLNFAPGYGRREIDPESRSSIGEQDSIARVVYPAGVELEAPHLSTGKNLAGDIELLAILGHPFERLERAELARDQLCPLDSEAEP